MRCGVCCWGVDDGVRASHTGVQAQRFVSSPSLLCRSCVCFSATGSVLHTPSFPWPFCPAVSLQLALNLFSRPHSQVTSLPYTATACSCTAQCLDPWCKHTCTPTTPCTLRVASIAFALKKDMDGKACLGTVCWGGDGASDGQAGWERVPTEGEWAVCMEGLDCVMAVEWFHGIFHSAWEREQHTTHKNATFSTNATLCSAKQNTCALNPPAQAWDPFLLVLWA
eukprot:m.242576 g.242576  ORF g.242576 m.242576 type:complete len:224 (-) comp19009_c0_seq1:282-953(-)